MIKNELDDGTKTSDQLRILAADAAKKLMTDFALLPDGETVFTELTNTGSFPVVAYQKAGADLLGRLGYGAATTEQTLRDTIATMQVDAQKKEVALQETGRQRVVLVSELATEKKKTADLTTALSQTQASLGAAKKQAAGSSSLSAAIPADLESQRTLLTHAINAQSAAKQAAAEYEAAKQATTSQQLFDAVFKVGKEAGNANTAFNRASGIARGSYAANIAEGAKNQAQLNNFAALALQEHEEVREITGTLSTITDVTAAVAAVTKANQAVADADSYANEATKIDAGSQLTADAKQYAADAKKLSEKVFLHRQSFLDPTSPLSSSSSTSTTTTTTTTTSGTTPADAAGGGGPLTTGSTTTSSSSGTPAPIVPAAGGGGPLTTGSTTTSRSGAVSLDGTEYDTTVFAVPKKGDKVAAVSFDYSGLYVLWFQILWQGKGDTQAFIDGELKASDADRANRMLALIGLHKTKDAFEAAATAVAMPADMHVTDVQMKQVLDYFVTADIKITNATDTANFIRTWLQGNSGVSKRTLDKRKANWTVDRLQFAANMVLSKNSTDTQASIHDLAMINQAAIDAVEAAQRVPLGKYTIVSDVGGFITRATSLIAGAKEALGNRAPVEFVGDDIPDLMAAYDDDQPDQVGAAVDDSSDIALTRAADIAGEASSGSMWTKAPTTAAAGAGASGQDLVSAALSAFFSAQ